MTTCLQLNGSSDYLHTPLLTVTRIVLDFSYDNNNPPSTLAYYLFDPRGGTAGNFQVYISTSGALSKGNNVSTLLYNSSSSIANPLPINTRGVLDATFSTAVTEDSNGIEFFINYALQATSRTKGKIYDIKLYNGATLLAHYDMTLGNANDQSGSGNNATLIGGTFVDDGLSGGTTTYVGSGASSGLASLSSLEKSILKDGNLIQVNPSLTVNEDMIMAMSGSVQALSSLSSGESLIAHSGSIYSGSGNTLAYSILSSNEIKNFATSGSLIGTSSMIDDHSMMLFEAKGDIISQAILSSKDLYNGKPNPQTFITNGSIQGHTLIFTKEVLNHFTIPFYQVAKIYLKGEQQLNVYLVGEMMNNITLKGSE
jgi:hypothetical protein